MFAAGTTSSSFTTTVMGHLARTSASDISSILIAKHDVQLQDLLDNDFAADVSEQGVQDRVPIVYPIVTAGLKTASTPVSFTAL